MLKRVPHSGKILSGVQDPDMYFNKLQNRARKQFNTFLALLQKLNVKGPYLEVGAGPGILAAMTVEAIPNTEIKAVEIDTEMIEIGRKHIQELGMKHGIQFFQGDVEDLSFIKSLGKFPLVYSTFSLHHWKNPTRALKALYNTIDEDGVMLLYDFRRVWWLYIYPRHNGFLDSIRASYLPDELKKMFKEAGILRYTIKRPFPYFWQIVIVRK